jgi:hypothetical protein
MRRFCLSLLILLTALRGVAGDAMALRAIEQAPGMLSGSVLAPSLSQPMKAAAAQSSEVQSEHHVALPCHGPEAAQGDDVQSHGGCETCQVCHSGVLIGMLAAPNPSVQPLIELNPSRTIWRSALLPAVSKPPIS